MFHTLFHTDTQAAAAGAGQPTPNAPLKPPPSPPFKVRLPRHRRASVSRLRRPRTAAADAGQHLRLRGGIWHFRRRVPLDLVPAFGGPEATLSLRTDRLRLARLRADQVDLRLSLAFAAARALGAGEEDRRGAMAEARTWMKELARRWAQEELDAWEEAWEMERALGRPVDDSAVEGLDEEREAYREALERGQTPEWIAKAADELLVKEGRTATAEELALLRRLLLRARLEVLVEQQSRAAGLAGGPPLLAPAAVRPAAQASADASAAAAGPPLAEAVEAYLMENERTWRPRTAANARSVLERFVQAVGPQRPLGSVGREDVRRWRDAMIEAGVSAKTANEYMGRYVGGFWNWATVNGHTDQPKPTKGLAIRVRQTPKDERLPFTDADLATIFGNDYGRRTGPERGRGATKRGPADYWLPLILLHTGCRPEEVAQLRLADIEELDGVLCFRIRAEAEDQSVKTAQSWREVPIHSFLVELGLLEYVAKMRETGEARLFPELTNPSGRGYVEQVGKRFHRRLRNLGITDKRKVLYSFRHTFKDHLYHADAQETVIKVLMGHTVEGETFGRYGGKVRATKLRDAVERLDFRGVLRGLLRRPRSGP